MYQTNYPQYNPQYGGYQQNPYQARFNSMQGDTTPRYDIVKVNGENGAKAFNLPPNSSVLLLDETAPIIWLKTTDGAGYPTITPYSITPYQAETKPDFNSLEARIKKLEDMIYEQSNNADVKPKQRSKATDTE